MPTLILNIDLKINMAKPYIKVKAISATGSLFLFKKVFISAKAEIAALHELKA